MERSFYMEQLPYIDEHATTVGATPERVWTALLEVLRHYLAGGAPLARVLGCDPARGTSRFDGEPGQALPGFRVVSADPERLLVLQGRHRFSCYSLTLVLDGDRLRAETRAVFPGLLGRVYRAAVIGSGAHRLVTRHLLTQVARRALPEGA